MLLATALEPSLGRHAILPRAIGNQIISRQCLPEVTSARAATLLLAYGMVSAPASNGRFIPGMKPLGTHV